jgi:FkbM family methyltransferase
MRILWANFYCLLDTSSGASISVRQILTELKGLGHEVRILGATIFDSPNGTTRFGADWEKIKNIKSESFFEVNDGIIKHNLLKTDSTERSKLTNAEELVWIKKYRLEIRYFKPDFIFFYGGGPGDLIPAEARAWNIPCGAYLVNGTFSNYRWCRDVDTFITDTNATRDYYREKLNIDPIPIGKFIGSEIIARSKSPQRLLYVNPSLAKGAALVLIMARVLERIKPSIKIEIIESRGDWQTVLKAVNQTLRLQENYLPGNIIITPNTTDMGAVYARTKLILVPSLWWESGARVIAEAQLNGIPVVATHRGGNPEMVGGGGITFMLPESCYRTPYLTIPTEEGLLPIAEKIIQLFENDEYYQKLSDAALDNANITSNAQINIKKFEDHLLKIIKKKQTWIKPNYLATAYDPFDPQRNHGEELLYEYLSESQKGIFIDCGGYDGCSAVKFILDNPGFESITFEPNPMLWNYYQDVPTTLIKKGVAGKTETRYFTIDEIDGDGSSFVAGKAIDYTKKVKNEDFEKIQIECIDICEVLEALKDYQKIVLKLDVEGAEYEILNRLLESGLISRISKLYAEWHWHKIGMSYEQHLEIYNRVKAYCSVQEWDALDMSIHNRDQERKKSRVDLLNNFIGEKIQKYQKNQVLL